MYLCKPLTTAILLLLAAFSISAHGPRYQAAIVVGLGCSLVGDVLLMLPQDRFVPGLAAFLLAHLAYLAAFTYGLPIGAFPILLVPLLAVLIPLVGLLWSGLGQYRVPVLIYTTAILLMAWQAWARRWALPGAGTTLAALGATLFIASDAALAFNRFRHPFRSAQVLVMTTYVAAQAMIALSVGTP